MSSSSMIKIHPFWVASHTNISPYDESITSNPKISFDLISFTPKTSSSNPDPNFQTLLKELHEEMTEKTQEATHRITLNRWDLEMGIFLENLTIEGISGENDLDSNIEVVDKEKLDNEIKKNRNTHDIRAFGKVAWTMDGSHEDYRHRTVAPNVTIRHVLLCPPPGSSNEVREYANGYTLEQRIHCWSIPSGSQEDVGINVQNLGRFFENHYNSAICTELSEEIIRTPENAIDLLEELQSCMNEALEDGGYEDIQIITADQLNRMAMTKFGGDKRLSLDGMESEFDGQRSDIEEVN